MRVAVTSLFPLGEIAAVCSPLSSGGSREVIFISLGAVVGVGTVPSIVLVSGLIRTVPALRIL